MKLLKRTLIVITPLFCLIALVWYIRAWMHGGLFGHYLFANAVFLSVSSLLMFVLCCSR
jgi:hypothetical protein